MKTVKRSTFTTLFIIKRNKILKNGEAPIALRITVNKQVVDIMVKRSIKPSLWNQVKQCSKGKGPLDYELNNYLSTVKAQILKIHHVLEMKEKSITAVMVKDHFLKKNVEHRSLLDVFKKHNEQCRQLIGNGYAAATVGKFDTSLSHLTNYLQSEYRKKDILLSEVTVEFIRGFEFYLKTKGKIKKHNAALKHMKALRKIIKMTLDYGWIKIDPFVGVNMTPEKTDITFLTMEELKRLVSKEITNERLAKVRDLFVFCCFTGLAFIDTQTLSKQHLERDNDGMLWIRKKRIKTGIMSDVPLFGVAEAILEKYKDHPDCSDERLLPTITNQKTNEYLKEIAAICGIKKELTTHVARYTCATTVMLGNKVSLENLSKILGHASTKMTKHYARVLDSSIKGDLGGVMSAFSDITVA